VTSDVTSVLEAAGIRYEVLLHARTETAGAEAEALGLPPGGVAKTLVVKAPNESVRAVLPASERIDLGKLANLLEVGAKRLHLATEEDLAREYPDFELGAVPPFGGASRDRVVIDSRLAEQESLVLAAGSHEQSLRMQTDDLLRLTGAEVAEICQE
jgi:Ala-tRNA(Pro) deacylase